MKKTVVMLLISICLVGAAGGLWLNMEKKESGHLKEIELEMAQKIKADLFDPSVTLFGVLMERGHTDVDVFLAKNPDDSNLYQGFYRMDFDANGTILSSACITGNVEVKEASGGMYRYSRTAFEKADAVPGRCK